MDEFPFASPDYTSRNSVSWQTRRNHRCKREPLNPRLRVFRQRIGWVGFDPLQSPIGANPSIRPAFASASFAIGKKCEKLEKIAERNKNPRRKENWGMEESERAKFFFLPKQMETKNNNSLIFFRFKTLEHRSGWFLNSSSGWGRCSVGLRAFNFSKAN